MRIKTVTYSELRSFGNFQNRQLGATAEIGPDETRGGMAEAAPLTEQFANMTCRQMLVRWAALHGGEIVVIRICHFAAASGFFETPECASSAMYKALRRRTFASRSEGHFERVGRGHYRFVPD